MIKLVSKNSEEYLECLELAKALADAEESIEIELKELTANLLRIARGAGKPALVVKQVSTLADKFDEYSEISGQVLTPQNFQFGLNFRNERYSGDEIDLAVERMISGALQIVASRLVKQATFEQRGRSELVQGIIDRRNAINERKKPDKRRKPKK